MKIRFSILIILILSVLIIPSSLAQGAISGVTYQQVITDDETISFAVPENWTIDTEIAGVGNIGIVSDPSILENEVALPLESGQVSILLSFLDSEIASENGLVGEDITEKLETLINAYTLAIVDEEGNSLVDAGEVEFVEATDLDSAYAQVTYRLDDSSYRIIFWDLAEGLLGNALIATADDEWDDYSPIILNIVQSVRYTGDDYELITQELIEQ